MALSPQDFKKHPQHHPQTKAPLYVTVVCKVRSCLPVRDIIHHLYRQPGNTDDPHRFLAGVFLLHAAQSTDATMRPWSALFIWNTSSPPLDLVALRPLAEYGSLHFLSSIRLECYDVIGYLQFHRLGQLRKTKGSDKGSKRTTNSANDRKPAPRHAKTLSQP